MDSEKEIKAPIKGAPLKDEKKENNIDIKENNNEIIKIQKINLIQFTKVGEISEIECIFFDKFSKRLIQILKYNVKIFNRTGTSLKKDITISLPSSCIHMVCVDKETNYMLVLVEVRDKTKMIPGINLNTQCVIDMLKGDFNYLMGMFFVTKNNFCLIFSHKIVYFKIDLFTDEVKELLTIKISDSNLLIQNFDYCRQFQILCIYKTDKTFDIYNLSKEAFYKTPAKKFDFDYTPKGVDYEMGSFDGGLFSSFFNNSSKIKKAQDKINYNIKTLSVMYSKSQFFLACIYTKLYFIYLCYEDGLIHFVEIENIVSFPSNDNSFTIEYKNHNRNSTLQFVDNLIFVHNFTKKEIMLIDIMLTTDKKIICTCKNVITFEERPFINGGIIEEKKNKILYYVNFDNISYLNQFPSKRKHSALINLTRRKNSKELILQTIKGMLCNQNNKYKINNIAWLFEEIAKEIKLVYELTIEIAKKQKDSLSQKNIPAILELSSPPDLIIQSKKATITQPDILVFVFKEIYDSELSNSEDFCIKIIIYMIFFYNYIVSRALDIIPNFNSVLLNYIKKIKEKNKLIEIFNMIQDFPISSDLGIFLLNNDANNDYFVQLGMNMLYYRGKYYDMFKYIIKTRGIREGLFFLNTYINKMDKESIKDAKKLLGSLLKNNKDVIYDFIDYKNSVNN